MGEEPDRAGEQIAAEELKPGPAARFRDLWWRYVDLAAGDRVRRLPRRLHRLDGVRLESDAVRTTLLPRGFTLDNFPRTILSGEAEPYLKWYAGDGDRAGDGDPDHLPRRHGGVRDLAFPLRGGGRGC